MLNSFLYPANMLDTISNGLKNGCSPYGRWRLGVTLIGDVLGDLWLGAGVGRSWLMASDYIYKFRGSLTFVVMNSGVIILLIRLLHYSDLRL
ncbi:hypothetical protein EV199_0947 [Pseudobacter ginsenosidimutans]|uniref:Uncharacterized protein n=1 Tax=Pseudobacter ginsenosidimutans TaxID=661488 RepID=A0A4Q7N0I0_9BACT|nr:hypothetical protein EV199_0947 [Pseudobacter ginsenosidimutans]